MTNSSFDHSSLIRHSDFVIRHFRMSWKFFRHIKRNPCPNPPSPASTRKSRHQCDAFRRDYPAVQAEIAKAIVGHEDIVDGVLTCLFVGGHALLEGVPGLGKTALIRALADALNLKFNRIQFTPDLMPADIIGTKGIIQENERRRPLALMFQPGPIFSQIVLADEINRATPKTQSALLEAMQEKQVTSSAKSASSSSPSSSWPPRTRWSRKAPTRCPKPSSTASSSSCSVKYSGREELHEILEPHHDRPQARHQPGARRPENHRPPAAGAAGRSSPRTCRTTPSAACWRRTRRASSRSRWSTSSCASAPAPAPPRRSRSAPRCGRCSMAASTSASRTSRKSPIPAMRHRVILNFEGEAEGITTDMVLEKVIAETPQTIEAELVAGKTMNCVTSFRLRLSVAPKALSGFFGCGLRRRKANRERDQRSWAGAVRRSAESSVASGHDVRRVRRLRHPTPVRSIELDPQATHDWPSDPISERPTEGDSSDGHGDSGVEASYWRCLAFVGNSAAVKGLVVHVRGRGYMSNLSRTAAKIRISSTWCRVR